MPLRNKLALLLTVISLGLLWPGLTFPILQVKLDAGLVSQFAKIQASVMDTSRSILGTVEDLWSKDNPIHGAPRS